MAAEGLRPLPLVDIRAALHRSSGYSRVRRRLRSSRRAGREAADLHPVVEGGAGSLCVPEGLPDRYPFAHFASIEQPGLAPGGAVLDSLMALRHSDIESPADALFRLALAHHRESRNQ